MKFNENVYKNNKCPRHLSNGWHFQPYTTVVLHPQTGIGVLFSLLYILKKEKLTRRRDPQRRSTDFSLDWMLYSKRFWLIGISYPRKSPSGRKSRNTETRSSKTYSIFINTGFEDMKYKYVL
jgi:hypothetical protein